MSFPTNVFSNECLFQRFNPKVRSSLVLVNRESCRRRTTRIGSTCTSTDAANVGSSHSVISIDSGAAPLSFF
jgi:hypothetical protein